MAINNQANINYFKEPLEGKTGYEAFRNKLTGIMESHEVAINQNIENIATNTTDITDLKKKAKIYTFDTVALMQADTELEVGDVIETLGYTTKNDTLGRKYIITATDVNSLGITVGSNFASKFEDEVSRAVGYTTNFTSATGTVVIPSGLPVGTRRLIRKVNDTQGIVTISCTGETFTASALSSVALNVNSDYWLLEKVTSTRWDLVDGIESGTNANGEYVRRANGVQKCRLRTNFTNQAINSPYGVLFNSQRNWTYPKSFANTTNLVVNVGSAKWSVQVSWGASIGILADYAILVFYDVASRATGAQFNLAVNAEGRWY